MEHRLICVENADKLLTVVPDIWYNNDILFCENDMEEQKCSYGKNRLRHSQPAYSVWAV